MMDTSCILALDCGATSVRAMVVTDGGKIIGRCSQKNATKPSEENSEFHVWDADLIFDQLCACSREATQGIDPDRIKAITVTTFGVDGALVDENGKMLYPVISWKCPRTAPIMANIDQYLPQSELNQISGVGEYAFNTLYKIIWLKENRPELFDKAKAWLFISSLFNYKLTGEMTTDRTMAGTSQMTDLNEGVFSERILNTVGLSPSLFPRMLSAGDVVGELLPEQAEALGIPGATPVIVSTGHDTQFAIFGSGAAEDQPVLSSGTWEILMVRTKKAQLHSSDYQEGATVEYDAKSHLLNPGLQWLGSGIIEWMKALVYPNDSFDTMDDEAIKLPAGSEGVTVIPDFLPSGKTQGSIQGLVLGRTRAHIYRATLEALTYRLKTRLAHLEHICGFKSQSLILVGGGSKNKVWNQMRADVLNMPVTISAEPENTVLGAAMFAFAGAKRYPTPEAAREAFNLQYETYLPGANREAYNSLLTQKN